MSVIALRGGFKAYFSRVSRATCDAGDVWRTRTGCCVRAVTGGMPTLDSSVPVGMTVMMLMLE